MEVFYTIIRSGAANGVTSSWLHGPEQSSLCTWMQKCALSSSSANHVKALLPFILVPIIGNPFHRINIDLVEP